jgi:glucosylceramidase
MPIRHQAPGAVSLTMPIRADKHRLGHRSAAAWLPGHWPEARMEPDSALVEHDGRATRHVPGGPPATSAADLWVTTPDGSGLLLRTAGIGFEPLPGGGGGGSDRRGGAPTSITIDAALAYQSFLGCGASITDSSAALLNRLPAHERDTVMAQLFSPDTGIGLSYLRQPIGSSAFVAGTRYYTCDDVPSGQTDFGLAHFTVARDETGALPLLRQARRLNPQLKVMATPWSAPAWMKTNGSLVGGELIDAPKYYEAYAAYLVRFVEAYQSAGVPVHALTLQNEPQNRNPDVPGMHLGVRQAKRLIHALGPALRRAGFDTAIVAFDHNWAIHPDDVASTPPGQSAEADYPRAILADAETARWVAGTAFHCYYGDPSAQSRLHERFPDKDVYFTECSGSRGSVDSDAKAFADTLRWHARNVIIGATAHWARTVVTWNLALDPSGGPHASGCTDFSGVVTVEDDDTVTFNAEYYTLAHLSKFVRPGARRIGSLLGPAAPGSGGADEIVAVAFQDPAGRISVLMHNPDDAPRNVEVLWNGLRATCPLPAGALATLAWTDPAR